MDHQGNQEQNERQVRYKMTQYYRWFWVGLIYGCVVLAVMMKACFGY